MLNPDDTFFVADFHFDHKNIIRYCDRPFRSVEEMNTVLLSRYNEVVKDDSTVYFVGDMAFGRGSHPPKWWLTQLRGHIVYLKGSHDKGITPAEVSTCQESVVLDTGIGRVLVIHEPQKIPLEWGGWTIHGHTHDKRLLNRQRRRICVSVEAINYRPISLKQIREAIQRGQSNVQRELSEVRR